MHEPRGGTHTLVRMQGGPSPAYNDMEYMDRNPKAKGACSL